MTITSCVVGVGASLSESVVELRSETRFESNSGFESESETFDGPDDKVGEVKVICVDVEVIVVDLVEESTSGNGSRVPLGPSRLSDSRARYIDKPAAPSQAASTSYRAVKVFVEKIEAATQTYFNSHCCIGSLKTISQFPL